MKFYSGTKKEVWKHSLKAKGGKEEEEEEEWRRSDEEEEEEAASSSLGTSQPSPKKTKKRSFEPGNPLSTDERQLFPLPLPPPLLPPPSISRKKSDGEEEKAFPGGRRRKKLNRPDRSSFFVKETILILSIYSSISFCVKTDVLFLGERERKRTWRTWQLW